MAWKFAVVFDVGTAVFVVVVVVTGFGKIGFQPGCTKNGCALAWRKMGDAWRGFGPGRMNGLTAWTEVTRGLAGGGGAGTAVATG